MTVGGSHITPLGTISIPYSASWGKEEEVRERRWRMVEGGGA